MDYELRITDEQRTSTENELITAFKAELIEGSAGVGVVIDQQDFRLACEELTLYSPDDVHETVPYVLIGFLRFGTPTVHDRVLLEYVLQFLNIRYKGRIGPDDSPLMQFEIARIAREREDEVSPLFTKRQARAIRVWLEVVRDSGVFSPESIEYEDIGFALEYWSERERGEQQQRE